MPSDAADTRRWLLDICHNIRAAQRFLASHDDETIHDDELVFYAITRCLEIISEASRRLPSDLKSRHPAIPWTEMAGAGNVYRHDYEEVDRFLIWGTVRERLPLLLVAVEQELAAGSDLRGSGINTLREGTDPKPASLAHDADDA